MSDLKIIAFAGLQLTGKTTLSRILAEKLRIPVLDTTDLRQLLFRYKIIDLEKEREEDERQMRATWESLYDLTEHILEAKTSVIVAGTFSREINHVSIKRIALIKGAVLKVIYCYAADETIKQRVESRQTDSINPPSNLVVMEGYYRVKARYQKISVSEGYILELNTAEPIGECLKKILAFV